MTFGVYHGLRGPSWASGSITGVHHDLRGPSWASGSITGLHHDLRGLWASGSVGFGVCGLRGPSWASWSMGFVVLHDLQSLSWASGSLGFGVHHGLWGPSLGPSWAWGSMTFGVHHGLRGYELRGLYANRQPSYPKPCTFKLRRSPRARRDLQSEWPGASSPSAGFRPRKKPGQRRVPCRV